PTSVVIASTPVSSTATPGTGRIVGGAYGCGTMTLVVGDFTSPPAALGEAVELARQAARVEAAEGPVGEDVGTQAEDADALTHLFEAGLPGYRGWRWAVTVASAGPGTPVTVSEVVLLPGPDALVAPSWVPWTQRVRAGDLGVGDLLPADPD